MSAVRLVGVAAAKEAAGVDAAALVWAMVVAVTLVPIAESKGA
jgi:hypothetical protein